MSVPGCGAIGGGYVLLLEDSVAVYRAVWGTRGESLALGDVAEGSPASRGILRACLAGGGDIASAGVFQRGLGCIDLLGGVTVNREKSSATFDSTFVALRFIFGDAHANECSDQTAYGAAGTCSCKCRHDWAGCDERTDAGNSESADACEQSQRAPDHATGDGSGGCALRSFG